MATRPKVIVQASDPDIEARVAKALHAMDVDVVLMAFASQEELVGAFMHDAKNSLTSVTANVAFAQDVVGDELADVHDALVDAGESAARLVRQIDDLGVLTKAQSGMEVPRREADVGAVLEGVVRRGARWAAAFGATIRPAFPKNLYVQGDAELLGHAFSEVFDLAVRYAGPKAVVEIGAAEESGQVHLWIRHDGRALESNPRLAAWMGGARRPIDIGFGLAVAFAVANAHRGTLEVRSTSNGSAEILMKLPRV